MAQSNWRWCQKCQGLFFGGFLGVCPAGGTHDGGQSVDYLVNDQASEPGEPDWYWCKLCSGLFFAGNPTTGWCPSEAGGHTYEPGAMYFLQQWSGGGGVGHQGDWRWCNRCQGLFSAEHPTTGCCPAGGGHDYAGKPSYVLRYGVAVPVD
jgi:hypothetical protein